VVDGGGEGEQIKDGKIYIFIKFSLSFLSFIPSNDVVLLGRKATRRKILLYYAQRVRLNQWPYFLYFLP
jgi:hypothetical protein